MWCEVQRVGLTCWVHALVSGVLLLKSFTQRSMYIAIRRQREDRRRARFEKGRPKSELLRISLNAKHVYVVSLR